MLAALGYYPVLERLAADDPRLCLRLGDELLRGQASERAVRPLRRARVLHVTDL